jgi:diguanylate cyclase (GGDEF)-like protein
VVRTNLVSAELDRLASRTRIDPLTGMSDAADFARQLDTHVSVAKFGGDPVAVLLLDVDSFAEVDSALGRVGGDRVLAEVAAVIKEQVGRGAELYRLSGDAFGLIAPSCERAEAAAMADGVISTFRGLSAGSATLVTVSIGYASVPLDAVTSEGVLRAAEHALRWAKMRGKARAVGYDPNLGRSTLDSDIETGGRSASRDMVRALSAAADAREPANAYHSRNVAALSRLVAVSMGFEPEHVRRVEIAGLLHDVGVIALPDRAVRQARNLTETAVGREHCVIGAQLVAPLGLDGVTDWVLHHHESWDGEGYPDGLKGDRIPVEARIVALADSFDGMTAGKRHGVAMSKWAALQEIDLNIGVRFDPSIAERFIEVVGNASVLGWSDEWRQL